MYRELLLAGKLTKHCTAMDKTALKMAERIRANYLKMHPVPADTMERIHLSELAQEFTADFNSNNLPHCKGHTG